MKQSVYVMLNPWLPFRVKIGISNKVERRERETGAFALFHFRLPYAAWIERGIHAFYSPLHWPASKKWSGHTEYFVCLNPMAACALFLLFPTLPTEAYLITLALPVPIDAAAILYTVACIAYASILAVIALSVYAFTLLIL